MSEFAAALNKQHRDEMSAMAISDLEAITRLAMSVEALDKRLAAVEAKLADSRWLWDNAAAALGTFPPAPAANTDPTA